MASNVLCNYWFIYLLILIVYTSGIASSDYEHETNADKRALGVGNWEQSALPKGESVFVIIFSPTSSQLWKEKKAFSFAAKRNLWIVRIVSISLHAFQCRLCSYSRTLTNGHLSTMATFLSRRTVHTLTLIQASLQRPPFYYGDGS